MAPTQWLPHAIPIPILYHCSSWTSSKDMMDPPRPGPSCGARRPTVEYTLKKRENTSNKMNIPWLTCLNWWVIAVHFTSISRCLSEHGSPQRLFKHGSLHFTLADPPIASWKLCMVRDKIRRKPWSFGWSVWGVAAAVPPVTDSLFAWKKWPVEAKATNGKLSWNYVL